MFKKYSMTGTGVAIVTALNAIFPLVGVEVPDGSTAATAENITQVFGFALLIVGQLRRSDLEAGIMRK